MISKTNKASLWLLLIISGLFLKSNAQGLTPELTQRVEQPRHLRIMFYNCENLFDYIDDTLNDDTEFTPQGDRYWTKSKYYNKLSQTAKVITAVGGWLPPEIVGLCEVENKNVLFDLTRNSPLHSAEYSIIHNESPDLRGIDVALLYQPKKFKPILNQFITINFPNEPEKKTRQILYTCGIALPNDTIHIFVNHWPSKYGGVLETIPYRKYVASVLKMHTDSIINLNPNASIIIMGDLNDEPHEASISEILQAMAILDDTLPSKLYNVTQIANSNSNIGTHKYQGTWSYLDQFIVSGHLLQPDAPINLKFKDVTIFNAPFLLEVDESYLGVKPFRSFNGFSFQQGYSDHLPVFIDLNKP